MNARNIIPYVPDLLKNELGLSISLLFREELIMMKKIIDNIGFHHLYHTYLISKEIEDKIDPTVISLLLTDAQKYVDVKTDMATRLDAAVDVLLYPGNDASPGLRGVYKDILYNLVQPVRVTVDGKVVTVDFDGDVRTTVRFAKRRDPEPFPDYKWYQAPGDKLGSKLK